METRLFFIVLCILAACRLVFVGDIPFGNDDAQLFERALADNDAFRITTYGLLGSRGLDYGPLAIWFYRTLLFFTHDILLIATVRIVLVASCTLYVLWTLMNLFQSFKRLCLLLVFLSPYLWFYGRDLWDNSLVIPLSGLAVSQYLLFVKEKKVTPLWVASISATCGVLTHLVFLPVALALLIHFLIFERQWLKDQKKITLGIFVSIAVLLLPYALHVAKSIPKMQSGGGNFNPAHFLMPLLAPRFFTALGMEHFIGKTWSQNPLVYIWGVSIVAYPLCWYGIWLATKEVRSGRREQIVFHFAFLALISLFLQMCMSQVFRLIPIPNFHSPQWIFTFFFLWISLDRMITTTPSRILAGTYAVSLGAAIAHFTFLVHTNGGSRWEHYGPTLQNLISVVKESQTKEVRFEVEYFGKYPYIWPSLQRLVGTSTSEPNGTVIVAYSEPANPHHSYLLLRKSAP